MAIRKGLAAKALSVFISIALVIGLIPVRAIAVDGEPTQRMDGNAEAVIPANEVSAGETSAPSGESAKEGTSEPVPSVAQTPPDSSANDGEVEVDDWGSLQKMVNEVENGKVIRLTGDVVNTEGQECVRVAGEGRSVTIDLGGHKLDRHLASVEGDDEHGGKDDGYVVEVLAGTTLTIVDSSATDDKQGAGTITGGWATNGGGIYVREGATLNLEAGMIVGNKADACGGGVFAESGSKVSIKGRPVVQGNDAGSSGCDIYLSAGGVLSVEGTLAEDAKLGISLAEEVGTFTKGYGTHNEGKDPARYFAPAQGYVVFEEEGEVMLGIDDGDDQMGDSGESVDDDQADDKDGDSADKSEPSGKGTVAVGKDTAAAEKGDAGDKGTAPADKGEPSDMGGKGEPSDKGTAAGEKGEPGDADGKGGKDATAGDGTQSQDAVKGREDAPTQTSDDKSNDFTPAQNDPKRDFVPTSNATLGTLSLRTTGLQAASTINSWSALQTAIRDADNGTTIELGANISTQGLAQSILIPENKEITLDLKGYTLNRGLSIVMAGGSAILLLKGAKLTITDTSQSKAGKITGGRSMEGGGVYLYEGSTLTLEGGTISGNSARNDGGGVCVSQGATLNLNGGTICDNKAGSDGGGVSATEMGGGIYVSSTGSIQLKGATICDNTSDGTGGGLNVHLKDATGNYIEDCTISKNTADEDGGGLRLDKSGMVLEVTNTNIKDNTASENGGGIYLRQGTIKITGGEISGNTAFQAIPQPMVVALRPRTARCSRLQA